MVTVVQRTDPTAGFGKALGEGITAGLEERKNRGEIAHDESAIRNAIEKLGPEASMRDIVNAVSGVKTYRQESKQTALKNLAAARDVEFKEKEFAEKIREAKARETLTGRQLDIAEGKANQPKLEKPTEFQKGLAKENVKLYIKSGNDVVAADRTLKDLDRLEQLNNELSGPLGYFNALDPFNEKAAELTSLGFGVLEAPVHIFNPAGPIAQKKLEQLQKIYGINRLDSSATIKGKISALKRYAIDLRSVAQQRLDLFEKYDGNPPLGEVARLDAKGNDILDIMAKSPVPGSPIEAPKDAPDAKKFQGKSIKFPDGNTYYSDGEVWRAK